MAFGSTAGPWAMVGFGGLAIAWLGTTIMAWRTAIVRDFSAHRAWAIRSWSLTFAAVTFRFCLPIFPMLGLPFVEGYRAASIYAWLINLSVAEWVVRLSRRDVQQRRHGVSHQRTSGSKLHVAGLSPAAAGSFNWPSGEIVGGGHSQAFQMTLPLNAELHPIAMV